MQRALRGAGTAVGLLACPALAHANVGVPMFSNLILYSILLLIPIIAIEAYVLRKRLPVSVARACGVSSLANVISTFFGSLLVLALGFAGLSEMPGGMGDVTLLAALVPCYVLSVWCESSVAMPHLKSSPPEGVRGVFGLANRFTYAMLGIVALGRLVKNFVLQGSIHW